MISRIWWVNLFLSAATLVVLFMTIGVLSRNPAIPSTGSGKSAEPSDKWPDASEISYSRKLNPADFDSVVEKNTFSPSRKFSDKVEVAEKAKATETAKKDEPKEIEEGSLELFATICGGSLDYAIISNPGVPEITRPQIRVKKGDKIGDYTIDSVESKRIIVTRNNEAFEVKLKRSKALEKPVANSSKGSDKSSTEKGDKKPANKTTQSPDSSASKKTKAITSVSTPPEEPKKSAEPPKKDNNPAAGASDQQKPDSAGKNLVTEGGETFEIMNTPFGTVKRKVK